MKTLAGFICGDGKRFATQREATRHADAVYARRGVVISVEATNSPASPMKSLADFKRRISVGARLECVENTKVQHLAGTRRTVTKTQGNGFYWLKDGDDRRSWTPYPAAKDFKVVDADTADLTLTPGHYVRLRFLQETAHSDKAGI
jgi:hypothetical protein